MVALNQTRNPPTSVADSAPQHRKTPPDNNSFPTNRMRSLLRARYYDPHTAEFLSPDPLEYVDGMSVYRAYFVLNRIDPEGRFSSLPSTQDEVETAWDMKPGTINLKINKCGPDDAKGTCGCCTNVDIRYIPTALDKTRFTKIYMKQWARSRLSRKGNCWLVQNKTDSGWHEDPPIDTTATWPPFNPDMTDSPAVFPNNGRTGCGDACATKNGRQDFETCVIGVLPSGIEVNIGCVHWGHDCSFTYEAWSRTITDKRGHPIGCEWGCNCTSTISRYPTTKKIGVTPQPQKPATWDPETDPPSWPGGASTLPSAR